VSEAGTPADTPPTGADLIRSQLPHLPQGPGVYRMLGADQEVLYVGKARNLQKRVGSYVRTGALSARILRMVDQTRQLEIISTHTEPEALLLEANLIKRLKPRYNVSFRDDKSFPYIFIPADQEFPQIVKHRGARERKGDYFGPFASTWAVNRTVAALSRAFPLRTCSDGDFATRTRPCLQYQIKRCTAPCVDRISAADYRKLVDEARDYLTGRNDDPAKQLTARMEAASAALDFETAAIYRDRIRALAHITSHQDVNVAGLGEADVVALHLDAGQACIQIFFFRAGQNFGNRAYFPRHTADAPAGEILAAFLAQFYEGRPVPKQILLSEAAEGSDLLAEALALKAGHAVEIAVPQRGTKKTLVEQALTNAREALGRRLAESASQRTLLEGVADLFDLPAAPDRIEVYDNSHIQGRQAIGGMIVAGPDGFIKNAYRKFNLDDEVAAGGDDFAMMRAVLTRRFSRLVREDPERQTENWPDLVLVDGGAAQLAVALEVLSELGISDVPLVGIAKGPDRDAGREQFHLPGRAPFMLEPRNPVLYFLQRLRDEAHRFAIGGHRVRRSKAVSASTIDEIPGIGPGRKRALLLRFGSVRGIAEAGLADLEKTEGVSKSVAKKIYDHFHG
jgi:excinuclease ABC subunit C